MEDRLNSELTIAPATATAGAIIVWLLGTMVLWFFAFYDASQMDADWIKRAQSVCFGRTASGLPDTYGWTILVLAPLSLLLGLVVSHPDELKRGLAAIWKNQVGNTLLTLLLGVGVIEGGWVGHTIYQRLSSTALSVDSATLPERLPAGYPRMTKPAPDFLLVNKDGDEVSLAQFRGKAGIVTFVFSHCQTVCPGIVNATIQVLKNRPTETFALFITLDPWRDTPSSLATFTENWKLPENAQILSGPVDKVTAVLDAYGIPRDKDAKTGDITHPALVSVISPQGELAYSFNNPTPQWLEDALTKLRIPQTR